MKKMTWMKVDNLPIRYKLIIHFLLISILPSIGLGFLISWTVDRIIEKQTNEHTLQLISKVNKSLEYYVGNMQNMTYFISFNPEIKKFMSSKVEPLEQIVNDHYDIKQFLQGFTTLYSEVAGILVVNNRGEYISNEMYARSNTSLKDETWYQEAIDNKGIFTIVGHPSQRNITTHVNYRESEVISVVRAILDPDTQQVKGVVLIDLKLRVIAETAKDVRLGKSGYLMVIDDKGENIYSPNSSLVSEIQKPWMGESNQGTFSQKVKGTKIYRKSSFTNWTTVGVFSTKESVFEVREIRFYVISFVFMVCLFGIAASYYLSHSMSRPIRQLMSFMQKAESGDLTIRYWGERKDEVGMLGRSFNTMIVQVNKLISLTELQERQKREAELRILQAHIKPHFLYNTLDTIHWMARKKGAEDVAEVVESLSKLFRIGLSKGNDMIPIVDEIEHIRSYLKIQQTRYKDKLNATITIASNIQDLYVLKLVLQPIVENAIYHGIKARRGPGHIRVEAEEMEGNVVMRVIDDGKGIPADTLAELRAKLESNYTLSDEQSEKKDLKGYGIMNVQARIKLTFGETYGIFIDSQEGSGTVVTIVHPVIKEQGARNDREERE